MKVILTKLQGLGESFLNVLRDGFSGNSSMQLTMLIIIVLVMGLTFGWFAKKLKMPLLLGYILAGILLRSVCDFLVPVLLGEGAVQNLMENAGEFFRCTADLGVALLLFTMGLEFEKKDIEPIKKLAFGGTLLQVFLSFGVGIFVSYYVAKYADTHCPELFAGYRGWVTYCIFGATFVSTSTAVVLKTLTNTKQITKLSAKVMIAMSIVQDLTVIPLFLLVSIASTIFGGSDGGIAEKYTSLILMAIFFVLFCCLAKLNKKSDLLQQMNLLLDSSELLLMALIFFALFFGCFAHCFQVSFSFGAFLAGILLSESPLRRKAVNMMEPVRDVFVLIFFVSIGAFFKVDFFLKYWGIILIITVATSLSRTIPLAVVSWWNGFRNVIPFAMLFGMFPTSEIAFVVASLAEKSKFISEELCSLIVCSTVISMLVGPVVDRLTAPAYKLWRRLTTHQVATGKSFPIPPLTGNVVVIGQGEPVRFIMRKLRQLNEPCMLLDIEENIGTLEARKLNDATDGIRAFYGSAKNLLDTARLKELQTEPKMLVVEQGEASSFDEVGKEYVNGIQVPLVVLVGRDDKISENVALSDTHAVIRNYDLFIASLEKLIAKK